MNTVRQPSRRKAAPAFDLSGDDGGNLAIAITRF
jgi:hypothetical protein